MSTSETNLSRAEWELTNEMVEAATGAIRKHFMWSDKPDGNGGFESVAVYGDAGSIARAALVAVAASFQEELAEAWEDGSRAGWSDRTRSIVGRLTYEQEQECATSNPFRSGT